MRFTLIGTILLFGGSAMLAEEQTPKAGKDAAPQPRLLGVRVVKKSLGLTKQTPGITFPEAGHDCRLGGYRGENAQEFYFDVEVAATVKEPPQVRFACPGVEVRQVWVGQTKVAANSSGEAVTFPLVFDARNPYALHINVRDVPEVLLYYMPKPSSRASGPYRDVPWPAAAAAAEANLMFALRDAFLDMNLSQAVGKEFDGYVAIGGFETTYPRVGRGPGGHEDFPPHLHLFLVVPPGWRIRQAGHLYLDEQGRLTAKIHCSPSACSDPAKQYAAGELCVQRDFADRPAFEFRIDDGVLMVRRGPAQTEYRLRPLADSGSFTTGCQIDKAGQPWRKMQVTDDCQRGLLQIRRQSLSDASPATEETIRYDPDTAAVVEHQRPR
jgi:hypothetical protein